MLLTDPVKTEPLVLDELDREGVSRELSEEVAARLAESGLVEVRPQPHGHYLLLPRGPVGVVRVNDVQVVVTPKERVGLANLLFLLGYARNPGFRPEFVDAAPEAELWPALGHAVAMNVEHALSQGVLQGYQTKEEALRTIRGRIRFGDQISLRPGLLVPIEVTYDEYTVDTAENQILLAALTRMLGVPRLCDDVRQRLLHLCARLEGVSRLSPGAAVPTWTPSRLNLRYQSALQLAEIVLRHCAAEAAHGTTQVASFVVTMSTVFEDFVTTALAEAMTAAPGHVEKQFEGFLTGEGDYRSGAITMAADLVHLDASGRPSVVFDAKYKFASPTGAYANADHYQMLAYCTAFQVPTAWLVYAAGAGDMTTRRVKHTQIDIVEAPLDMSLSPEDVLSQVQAIADAALARAAGAAHAHETVGTAAAAP